MRTIFLIGGLLLSMVGFCCGVTAGFTPSATTVCAGEIVNFTNTSTGATSYEWHLEGFTFAITTDAILSFGSPGNFNIELLADDGAGCLDSITIVITVENPPYAGSDFSATFCNIDDSLDLNTEVDGDVGGSWNELTSSGQFNNTTGMFNFDGLNEDLYQFEYVVTSTGTCPNDTAFFDLSINQQPTLNLNLGNTNIGLSDSLLIDFDTSGTNVITSFIWQFCDGNFLGEEDPFYYQWSAAGNYCVCVSINNNNGCQEQVCDSSIVVVDDLGTNQHEFTAGFKVYPNPATDNVLIEWSDLVEPATIRIFSSTGQLIKIEQVNSKPASFDVTSLATGSYYLQIDNGAKSFIQRFVKE